MLIVMCMIGVVASVAWAYPGPDSFGIYKDDEIVGYPELCADVAAFTQLVLYCCITQPTGYQVAAWEGQVEIVPPATSGDYFGAWTLVAGLNVGSGIDYLVGIGDGPLTPNGQDVVVLMTMTLVVVNATIPINYYIRGVPGSLDFPYGPGYAEDVGVAIPCVNNTGGPTEPVFIVNPTGGICTPVGNEDASWGAVKTLYK